MSDLVKSPNPLDSAKEQIAEVLELLNQPNLPIAVQDESTLSDAATELPAILKAE